MTAMNDRISIPNRSRPVTTTAIPVGHQGGDNKYATGAKLRGREDITITTWKTTVQMVVHVLCALCALGFKKDGKVRTLERYTTQRSFPVWVLTSWQTEYEYDVSVHLTGTAEIYSSTITKSDIHYRMLSTIVLLIFPLKCCVMTQQEGIMRDVYTFAGTDQCQLPEYGPYSYICKSIY